MKYLKQLFARIKAMFSRKKTAEPYRGETIRVTSSQDTAMRRAASKSSVSVGHGRMRSSTVGFSPAVQRDDGVADLLLMTAVVDSLSHRQHSVSEPERVAEQSCRRADYTPSPAPAPEPSRSYETSYDYSSSSSSSSFDSGYSYDSGSSSSSFD